MRRLADAERAAADGDSLQRVADEIDEDRTTLLSMIHAEGIEPRWYKSAMARVGEELGVLKTNGALFHRSPLTSLVELEAMRMGVTGKLDLWSALKHSALADREDFDSLIERATRQLHALELAHARRAAVLSDSVQPASS